MTTAAERAGAAAGVGWLVTLLLAWGAAAGGLSVGAGAVAAGVLGLWAVVGAALLVGAQVLGVAPRLVGPPAGRGRVAALAAVGAVAGAAACALLMPSSWSFRSSFVAVGGLAGAVLSTWVAGAPLLAGGLWAVGRITLAGPLAEVFMGRELLLDLATLAGLTLAALAGLPGGTRARRAGALGLVPLAAAVALFATGAGGVGDRAAMAEAMPGAGELLSITRGLYDLDGDGWSAVLGGQDCDDTDDAVHPLALERVANGVDDNCIGGDLASLPPPTAPGLHPPGLSSVVLITVDSLRADAFTAQGMPEVRRWAQARGAVFTRAYAQAPFTEDSIASLMSARWPMAFRHGPDRLPLPALWPAHLRDSAGWRAEAVVTADEIGPEVAAAFDRWDDSLAARHADPRGASADEVTTLALGRLAALRAAGRPFLLWAHYLDPHIDYMPRAGTPFAGDDDWDRYRQEVFATDRAIGRLLAAIGPETLVVFTSDHGEAFGEKGHRVHALWVDEVVLKVPLVLAGPGVRPGVRPTRVRLLDLGPTLSGLPGDGVSLWPILQAPRGVAPDRDVFAQSTFQGVWIRAAITGAWKLIQYVQLGTESLYDLSADPAELHDLVDARPAKLAALRDALGRRWDLSLHAR